MFHKNNGEPLCLKHGSLQDFTEFCQNDEKIGILLCHKVHPFWMCLPLHAVCTNACAACAT